NLPSTLSLHDALPISLRHPDVRELAPAGGWASLGLALRLGKIDLRHFVVVRIDELLRIQIGTDLLRERQEGGACPRRPRRWLRRSEEHTSELQSRGHL